MNRDTDPPPSTAQAARDAEVRRAIALAAARIGDGYIDVAAEEVVLSLEAASLLGLGIEGTRMPLERFIGCMHPDDRQTVATAIGRIILERTAVEVRFRTVHPNGTVRWLVGRGQYHEEAGRARVLGVLVDIHHQVTLEELASARQTAILRTHLELQALNVQLQTLSARVIGAQEEERARISRELHDEIGQVLTACVLGVEFAATSDDPGPVLREVQDDLRRVLQQLRDLSLELRPPMLDEGGLEPALRWLLERQTAHRRLHWTLRVQQPMPRPSAAVEITAFRIVQEALTNLVKHAQARNVVVEVRADDVLLITVADDGVGFDVGAQQARGHRVSSQGVLNMGERATLLGGHCEIRSVVGAGTTVFARLPLEPVPPPPLPSSPAPASR